MKRRGLTLLELLTALAIAGLLVTALATAFSSTVRYQLRAPESRRTHLASIGFEDRMRALLRQAFVDESETSVDTYFIGRVDEGGGGVGSEAGATELIFTSLGARPSGFALDVNDDATFEDRNERWGPVGGLTEVRLGTSAIGDSGTREGLFIREQIPPDEDIDQGGFESVFDDRLASASYEFWDGEDWLTEWDTRNGTRRIPAAIRVSYVLSGDDEEQKQFVVRLDDSDVTTANPASATTQGVVAP